MNMVNEDTSLKIKKKTLTKFIQLKALETFRAEKNVKTNELLESLLEDRFKTFDNSTIEKMKNH